MKLFNRIIIRFLCAPAALAFLVLCPILASAQWDKKPYLEWSEKETMKLLNDSPWGQTQTYTDTSRMFDRNRRLDSGESRIAEVNDVIFRIRFLSAKPIRQAIARYMDIQHKGEMNEQLTNKLNAFAAADFPDFIIVTVQLESAQANRDIQAATAVLQSLTTSELKNNTYLLAKGGERLFLHEYQPPRNDGLGARFVFPRTVDGKPYLTPETSEVLFYTELNSRFVPSNRNERKPLFLSTRYKVKDMVYQGKLEY